MKIRVSFENSLSPVKPNSHLATVGWSWVAAVWSMDSFLTPSQFPSGPSLMDSTCLALWASEFENCPLPCVSSDLVLLRTTNCNWHNWHYHSDYTDEDTEVQKGRDFWQGPRQELVWVWIWAPCVGPSTSALPQDLLLFVLGHFTKNSSPSSWGRCWPSSCSHDWPPCVLHPSCRGWTGSLSHSGPPALPR